MKSLLTWVGLVLLLVVLGFAGIVFGAFHGLSSIEGGQRLGGVEVVKAIFMGDSAEATSDGVLAPAKRLTSDNPAQNRDSLARLAARLAPATADVRFIAPAHSGVLAKGLAPLLDFARTRGR